MSYFSYSVHCDKCGNTVTTSFGMVGSTIIAEPIIDCTCGGKYKKVENENNQNINQPSE